MDEGEEVHEEKEEVMEEAVEAVNDVTNEAVAGTSREVVDDIVRYAVLSLVNIMKYWLLIG